MPHFPGLGIEFFLAELAPKVPVMNYLPDPRPVMKVPRSFVLDVRSTNLYDWQVLRTLALEEFDLFVKRNIAGRQEKIIEKTNQAVEILPIFAAKLAQSHLMSRKARPTPELREERESPQHPEGHCP